MVQVGVAGSGGVVDEVSWQRLPWGGEVASEFSWLVGWVRLWAGQLCSLWVSTVGCQEGRWVSGVLVLVVW